MLAEGDSLMTDPFKGMILFYGPIYQRSGFGVVARTWVTGFHKAGIKVRVVPVDCAWGEKNGLDDTDLDLMRRLEFTPLEPPVTAIFAYVATYLWPKIYLPSPHLRIMMTTFSNFEKAPSPSARLIFMCNQMDQVWIFNKHEEDAWVRGGLDPNRIRVVSCAQNWIDNPLLPKPFLKDPSPDGILRFLHISLFMPRRRMDALIQAYLEEFRENDKVELYLKINYQKWHPIPDKPRRDLHELIERLRKQTGSNASIMVDEDEGTRKDIASIIDQCDMYISTDIIATTPVAEAMIRLRPVIISDGWGFDISDQVIVIPNSEREVLITPEMAEYMPHQKGTSFPAVEISEVRKALRRGYDMDPSERHAMAAACERQMRARYSYEATIPDAIEAIRTGWERKNSNLKPVTRGGLDSGPQAGVKGKRSILWAGIQLFYGAMPNANRNICLELLDQGHEVSINPANGPFQIEEMDLNDDPTYRRLANKFYAPLSRPADIFVSHYWHAHFNPNLGSHFVIINTWRYGSVPKLWIRPIKELVDELWVPSYYVRDNFIRSGIPPDRIQVIPFGVNTERFCPEARPYALKTRKRFKFLFVGESHWRKGFDILIKAYFDTFTAKDDVCLVVKDIDSDEFYARKFSQKLIREYQAKPGLPEIEYIDDMIKDCDMPGVYTACDCLVQPYRATSFGMAIVEAMSCGLPVIVTGQGASLDFCSPGIAFPIPAKEVKLQDKKLGSWETVDSLWVCDPDIRALKSQMKFVINNQEEANQRGKAARASIQENFTWKKTVNLIEERIGIVCQRPIRHLNANPDKKPYAPSSDKDQTPSAAALSEENAEKHPVPGTVVWVAPFYNRSGYGVGARAFVTALHKAGVRIRTLPVNEVDPGIDDCDLDLIKSLEKTPLQTPITAIFSHVPSQAWLDLKLPEPNLRIMATTFDSSAQGNLPPAEWLSVCKKFEQVWLMTKKEVDAFSAAGLSPDKIQIVSWPHSWLENAVIPPVTSEITIPGKRFRFLSIAMFQPRRRWDTLIEAYLEEFKGNEDVELYLKVNYPSWHPVPGKPRQDLHNLVRSLRLKASSSAMITIDEELGKRSDIVRLIDGCNAYISTDTAATTPIAEAWVRKRLVIIPEGLGLGIPEEYYIAIPVDLHAKSPLTEDMLLYQPHHKGAFMPLLSVKDVRHAMRRAYEMSPNERQAKSISASSCVWGPTNAVPEAIRAIKVGWQYKMSEQDKNASKEIRRIVWEGSQFVYHSLALINRELCLKLIDAGYDLSIIPYEKHSFGPEVDGRFHKLSARFNKRLEQQADIHVRLQWPPNFTPPKEGHWVIIQPWEFGSLPKTWVEVMGAKVDEMWVPSNYVRDCYIKSGVPAERVFVVPCGVDTLKFNPMAKPFPLKSRKPFKFLFVGGTISRKGIDILLKAYTNAFTAKDDVCLVIKDMGGQSFYKGQTAGKLIAEIQKRADAPEIEYLEQMMNESDMAGLYTACSCLVHPYRGEGFGFPIAEAMACGLPVIVTGYGAALDFCSAETAYLIPSKEVKYQNKMVGNEETVDHPWLAEPDGEALSNLMQHVIKHPEEAKTKGSHAREFIQAHFAWDRAAEVAKERIRELCIKPVLRFEREKTAAKYQKPMIDGMASIIIPITREARHIKECVQAIRKRSPELHEIIFVEASSSNDVKKYLKKIVGENSNYRLLRSNKPLNLCACFNLGIRESSGEFIVFLNPDIVVTENWLSGMIECLNTAPDIGVVGPMTNNISGLQKVVNADYGDTDHLEGYAKAFREKNRYRRIPATRIVGFCMLFRRELVEKIGLLDETFGSGNYEDDDFCLRASLEGYRNVIAGDVFIHHYGSRSFTGNRIDYNSSMAANRKRFNEKWNGLETQSPLGKKALVLKAMEKADELNQRGQNSEAVNMLVGGTKLFPEDKRLYYMLSEMLMDLKKYMEALEILNEMAPDSNDTKKLALIGCCKEALELYEEAEEYANHALLLDPASPLALNLKGMLAYKKGDKSSAESFFKKAIEADPGYGEPYTNLGVLKWVADQKEEALNFLEKGFILSPTIVDVVTAYYSAITGTGEFSRAERVFEEVKGVFPLNKRIAFLLIDLLIKQGKNEAAMENIEDAMIAFGIDDGILGAAIEMRNRIGIKEIGVKAKGESTVSLCMIVKNEEQNLPKCLRSAKPVVDEIIIVDTGSTDKTKDIARAFGAKIYEMEWKDSFAEARNHSISKASGQWILVLDADEVVSPKDYDQVPKIVENGKPRSTAYALITRNYINRPNVEGWRENDGIYGMEEAGIGWFPSRKVRLFPNDRRIRFENPVHEFVEPSLSRAGINLKLANIVIHHYGKLDEEKSLSKGETYYNLGRRKLEEMRDNPGALREIAIQATELKKYGEAVELWKNIIFLQPDNASAYLNMGHAYLELGRYEDALLASKRAMELDPNMKEAIYNYSVCEICSGDLQRAIAALETLLKRVAGDPCVEGLLGVAHIINGSAKKGLGFIEKLWKNKNDVGEYIFNHAARLFEAGRKEYAISLLEAAIESKNHNDAILALREECMRISEHQSECSQKGKTTFPVQV